MKVISPLSLAVALSAAGCGARTGFEILDTHAPRDSGAEAAPPPQPFEPPDGGVEAAPPQKPPCVLYGGFPDLAGSDTDKGWMLGDDAWLPLSAPLSPPECAGHCGYDGAAVNAGGRLLFIVAASTSGATFMQTFTWNGTSLVEVATSNPPPARFRASVAATGDKVVMFGGAPPSGPFSFMSDTWILEGSAWTQIHPSAAPPPRWRAPAAAVGDKVVVFGGADGKGVLGDTWVFDGTGWATGPGMAAPSARSDATMATVGGVAVMFGGCVGGGYTGCPDVGTNSDETWQWGPGAGWTQLHPAASPPARNFASMTTYGAGALLLGGFAGPKDTLPLMDAWLWSGSWTPAPFAAPQASVGGALACE